MMSQVRLFGNGVYLVLSLLAATAASAAERPEMVPVPGAGFAIARTETTVAQWQACVDAGACAAKSPRWAEPDMPMTDVTVADAEAYAGWLTAATGRRTRLPTEVEWETAARAGTVTPWPWGDVMQPGRAVCHLCDPRFDHRPAPVATMAPNPLGLYDMHGNVWEWTADCWDADCLDRVVKGGSWYFVAAQTRSGAGAPQDARSWSYDVGFRVVVSDSD